MRILMVSDVYLPRINGVSTSISTLMNTLKSYQIDVELIVPHYGNEIDEEGITRIDARPVPGDMEDRQVSWRLMHRAVLQAAKNCDLIHIQTPFIAHYAGLSAARKLNLPVVTTYHTLFEEYLQYYVRFLPKKFLRHSARYFSRHQCNAMDSVIVPSSAMRHRLENYGVKVPMQVIPTGIPLKSFAQGQRDVFRQRHNIAADRPVALFVGRAAHEKNIGFLLKTWKHVLVQCPDLLLLIAGDGPALNLLKKQAHDLGLSGSVTFLGYLDGRLELPDCYAAADVFVFSSVTETQGLVLLEAMATGLPVIAISAMGTADILDAEKGCLIAPAEEQGFADIIVNFFANDLLRKRLQKEAQEWAAEWSDDICTARLVALYESLTSK